MDGYVVQRVFAVRVGQHATDEGEEGGGTATVGTEEQPPRVIVVGMEIVPYQGASPDHSRQLCYGRDRDGL